MDVLQKYDDKVREDVVPASELAVCMSFPSVTFVRGATSVFAQPQLCPFYPIRIPYVQMAPALKESAVTFRRRFNSL